MKWVFAFGEHRDGYTVPVLDERVVRAGAGILFFFAMVSFMTAWLTGNFQPTRVFVVAFLIDFTIRLFVNPRLAPSLVVGQWAVRRQRPEWVGAPQKRFAWGIGFVLALAMFFLIVVNEVVGPVNMVVCATCLVLMFFESAFGICIGCHVYNLLHKVPAEACPGAACAVVPDARQHSGATPWVVLAVFAATVVALSPQVAGRGPAPAAEPAVASMPADAAEAERCKVPDFAKAIGHEAMWKRHNNCR